METATNERRAKYLLPTRFYVVKILLSVFLSFTIKHYFETVFENSRDLSVTVQALAIVASLVVKTFRFFPFRMLVIFPIGNEIFLYLIYDLISRMSITTTPTFLVF